MKIKYAKTGKGRRILDDDHGVSPVIAVILMVAITVVMAAIVSSWSAGVKSPATPTTVGMDVSRSGYNITLTLTSIDPASAAPLTLINATYTNSTGGKINGNKASADVGDTILLQTGENGPNLLVVVATYKDSSKKVLYSREV